MKACLTEVAFKATSATSHSSALPRQALPGSVAMSAGVISPNVFNRSPMVFEALLHEVVNHQCYRVVLVRRPGDCR